MIFNNKILSKIAFVAICTFHSCNVNDYLDRSPVGGLSEDEVFGSYRQVEQYVSNLYARIPTEWFPGNPGDHPTLTYASVSDEALSSVQLAGGPHEFTQGLINANYNPMDRWTGMYESIRAVNIFLEKIDHLPTTNPTEEAGKSRMKGEGYFLRAWYYMELFKRYGGVPLVDHVLNINDELNLPRNTAEEIVDFISSDCDKAVELLLLENSANNIGRGTKGAALMLKAKAQLYLASKLHNPENNPEKWKNAAAAAQAVMDLNFYRVDGNYESLFHSRTSPNLIFQSSLNETRWVSLNFLPSLGGSARVQPLQNLVDAYEMKETGLGIFDPGSGFNEFAPYVGRDPRLAMSILYDGATWKDITVRTYLNSGTDGVQRWGGLAQTQTSYYLRKTVDENGNITPNAISGEHYWVYMRYEDVLLCYAEAQNEWLEAPDASVYAAVNEVRTRTGIDMPPLTGNLDKEAMRERIRHERRVELAFEGQRFWDIRRWRIGEQVMKEARGVIIDVNDNGTFYWPNIIGERIYRPAFDLFPIPQSVINRQRALDQNDGYTN
ncbi:RagB/SusD family nutrient uptake outer membrane protein [Sphingobacterium olei]|uniref:RagB/SusD family nutrient uptake outer membrane protein n=1 Tax=Sphingobacterium olei TaxID=2571155 RepID=A0A4U0P0K9_9SPHI|nr:RagB/SusD family nutrient uptake outer membrane protein [Sphingobacterium olei]TJZ60042.1 RagB/SusD family nutrient uptake outer membrane protein [Sphingobacterium olei]